MRRTPALAGIGLVALATLVVASSAHAQSAAVLDQMVREFRDRSAGWEGALRAFALNTFGTLALVQLAWAGIRLAFRGSDFSEWLAEIVNQILFLGFFLALLENSVTWGTAIVSSFRQAAGAAGGGGIAPSDVFASGVNIAERIMSQTSFWTPGASVGLIIIGVIVMVCFALIAAAMVLALVESYLIISMGVIFMAFGGTVWTKDFAISTVRYTVSVGAKLFVLQLLVSIGNGLITSWVAQFQDVTAASACILIGCAVVLLALVHTLPTTMQGVVNGSHAVGQGSALVGAAGAVGAGVTAAGTAMVGAPVAAGAAARLAGAQLAAADRAGTAPTSALSRAGSLIGHAGLNLGRGVAADVGRRLSGTGSRHGSAPWRVAADLSNRGRLLNGDAAAPRAGGLASAVGGVVEPWMQQRGGFDGLSPQHQASAQRSYQRWGETNPEAAARHGLHDYVAYVQERQAEAAAVPNTISGGGKAA